MKTSANQNQESQAQLTFKVGPYKFAVAAVDVVAIIQVPVFRPFASTQNGIAGVFVHRDQTATIISLHQKLGLPMPADKQAGQLILSHIGSGLTAFWVDEVLDMTTTEGVTPFKLSTEASITAFHRCFIKDDAIFYETDFERLFAVQAPVELAEVSLPDAESKPPAAESDNSPSCTSSQDAGGSDDRTPTTGSELPDRGQSDAAQIIAKPTSPRAHRPPAQKPVAARNVPAKRTRSARSTPLKSSLPAGQPQSQRLPDEQHRPATILKRPWLWMLLIVGITASLLLMTIDFRSPQKSDKPLTASQTDQARGTAEPKVSPQPVIEEEPAAEEMRTEAPAITAQPADPTVAAPKPDTAPPPAPQASTSIAIATTTPPPKKEINVKQILKIETEALRLTIERPEKPGITTPLPSKTAETITSETVHVVVKGDTLWHIAIRYLGDPLRYPELAKLSRIKDPDLIYPGDIIRIVKLTQSTP